MAHDVSSYFHTINCYYPWSFRAEVLRSPTALLSSPTSFRPVCWRGFSHKASQGWTCQGSLGLPRKREFVSQMCHLGVSKNMGKPPKTSILIGFGTIINHPFWGTPIFGNIHFYPIILSGKKNSLNHQKRVTSENFSGGGPLEPSMPVPWQTANSNQQWQGNQDIYDQFWISISGSTRS